MGERQDAKQTPQEIKNLLGKPPVLTKPGPVAPVIRNRYLLGSKLLTIFLSRTDLKLNARQQKEVDKASAVYRESRANYRTTKDEAAKDRADAEIRQILIRWKATLSPPQLRRLMELEASLANRLRDPSIFSAAEIDGLMRLTPRQSGTLFTSLGRIQAEQNAGKGRERKGALPSSFKNVIALRQELFDAFLATLDEQKKNVWQELTEKASEIPNVPTRKTMRLDEQKPPQRGILSPSVNAMSFLRIQEVRRELGFTAEQEKRPLTRRIKRRSKK